MNETLLISILAASITAGTPILFAALGELISERAGVTNLGVDGMMLVGACAGFIAAQQTGSLLSGVGMALLAGSLMALIHAFLTVTLRANQVVSGLALTLFGTGLSGYLGLDYVGQQATVVFSKLAVPGLSVIMGGALAGLGGAYLSLAYAPCWLENMTAGRGWIAVALVIFALWDPWRALLGSYLFGGIDALGFHLQVVGLPVSVFILNMLPYIFTIVVLILVLARKGGRLAAPQALGQPYDREER